MLSAGIDVKCGDEALSIIDATVFLANLFRTCDLLCSLYTLEAVKRAGCLRLEASLEIPSSDQTFAEIDAAILLAEAKIASHDCCESATECK